MAKALDGITSLDTSSPAVHPLRTVWMLRLTSGFTALLGTIIFFFGTAWDIQWHEYIGRDRTLIPPHQMMLAGVAISGLASLIAVLVETLWARRSASVVENSTSFADVFHGSLGAYVTGFAALLAAIAFPLDSYWHALYGIDVAIWAPFHIMFALGMAIAALGAAYTLMSATNLATGDGALHAKRVGYVGATTALATMMSVITLLTFDALIGRNFIHLGFIKISVFPVIAGLLVSLIFATAAYTLPWRWAATSVAAVYLLFAGIMVIYVQPATNYLLRVERLTYRRDEPFTSIVALEWMLAPVIAAILIDTFMWQARRKNWPLRKLTRVLATVALIGAIPAPIIYPLYILTLLRLGLLGLILSFLLGLLATFVGIWFGRNVGESLHTLER